VLALIQDGRLAIEKYAESFFSLELEAPPLCNRIEDAITIEVGTVPCIVPLSKALIVFVTLSCGLCSSSPCPGEVLALRLGSIGTTGILLGIYNFKFKIKL
jgi:hypothetical protein